MTNFDITHFNAGTQKESDFLATFIARQSVLQFFLTQLFNTENNQTSKHYLIYAPRGYGKTSLLRRIKIALRDDSKFNSRYIPLTFREEQHNVISLDVFWRNCLQSLLEAREDEHASEEDLCTLDKLWTNHIPRSDLTLEKQDGEPAWLSFSSYCRALDRRPVLLIDNLDLLLGGLVDQHQWALRAILQSQDGPILISAASRYPDCLTNHQAAFFDFFRVFDLKPLTDTEVMSCLRELAHLRGEKGDQVQHLLDTDPGRISALNTMAGGNPRTLSVLYMVLEANMSDDLLTQLGSMLDTFTGWYQARTDELALQSRAVFDALALNWDPMTAAEISKITGLDTPSVSSHLSRLEKNNYVETVPLSKTKKKRNGYQVAERFYNIWYLMRNGSRRTRQAIKFLTVFLRSCFSKKELNSMAKKQLKNGIAHVESTLALAATIADSRLRSLLLDTAKISASQFEKSDDTLTLIDEIRNELKVTEKRQFSADTKDTLSKLLKSANEYIENLNYTGAEQAYREAIALDENDSRPWILLGDILGEQPERYQEAEKAYRQAIKLDENDSRPWIALTFLFKDNLNNYEEAETACRKAILLNDRNPNGWGILGDLLRINTTRFDEAKQAYQKAISLDENDARPWIALGILYEQNLKLPDEAEAAYRKAITLNEDDAQPWALIGYLSLHLSRYEEAIVAFQKSLTLNDQDALIWGALADILHGHLDRQQEAENAYRRASELSPGDARPWIGLGNIYSYQTNRLQDAENAYRKAIALDGQDNRPWILLGFVLRGLKRYQEAEDAYRTSIALNEKEAHAWVALGDLLYKYLHRYEEAEKAYRTAIGLDESDARSWNALGDLLEEDYISRYEEAEKAYRQAIALDAKNSNYWTSLGNLLGDRLKHYDEAEYAFLKAIELDKHDAAPWIFLGHLLLEINRYEEAEAACRKAITLAENDIYPWILMAYILIALGRYDEAESACQKAVHLDEKNPFAWMSLGSLYRDYLARYTDAEHAFRMAVSLEESNPIYWNNLGNLLQDYLGKYNESLVAYKQGLQFDSKNPFLNANIAYVYALHLDDIDKAVEYALSCKQILPKVAVHLLNSMISWCIIGDEKLAWSELDHAIKTNDTALWEDYIDDLQRILAYIVVYRDGKELQQLMISEDYPTKYASIYHALCAAIDGEDYLLKINPEVRTITEKFYFGLNRLITIFKQS